MITIAIITQIHFSHYVGRQHCKQDLFKVALCLKDCLNQFPHDNILDHTKLKAFADDKSNVTKLIIPVFDRVENIVGKGEIA